MQRDSITIGTNVRLLRTGRGWSQVELARHVRLKRHPVSQCYISRIEGGSSDPRASTLRSLATALRVRPYQLLMDLEDPDFWSRYLSLSPTHKREVQRMIRWFYEGRR
jgi:transcriptional regulator with XRE-family HTH domain